jgi:hypothetical protein
MAQGPGGRMLLPMRKLLPITAVALTALTLTTLSSASATPSHPAHQPTKQVFTLTTKTIDKADIDVGAPGLRRAGFRAAVLARGRPATQSQDGQSRDGPHRGPTDTRFPTERS